MPRTFTYFGGAMPMSSELSAFANPDNLGSTPPAICGSSRTAMQPDDTNDGCFVCPTDGPERGQVRQFMSGPVGAEICGCEFTADGARCSSRCSIPGDGGYGDQLRMSHWPDGGSAAPRPSVVAIEPTDARAAGSAAERG